MVGVHHEVDMVRISTLVQQWLHLLRIIGLSGCWHLITQPYHGIPPRLLNPHGTPSRPRPGAGNAFVDAFIVQSQTKHGSHGVSGLIWPGQSRELSRCHGACWKARPRCQGQGHKAKAGDGAQAKITIVPSGVTNKQKTTVNTHTHKKKKTAEAHHVRDQESLRCKWQGIQLEPPGSAPNYDTARFLFTSYVRNGYLLQCGTVPDGASMYRLLNKSGASNVTAPGSLYLDTIL